MRSAICFVRLKARSSIDPDTDSGGACCEIGLGSHAEAIGESRDPGLRRGKDSSVVNKSWVGGSVLEEPLIGVIQLFELRFNFLGELIVDHDIIRRRRGRVCWRRDGG